MKDKKMLILDKGGPRTFLNIEQSGRTFIFQKTTTYEELPPTFSLC